jgi:hypothetical protein
MNQKRKRKLPGQPPGQVPQPPPALPSEIEAIFTQAVVAPAAAAVVTPVALQWNSTRPHVLVVACSDGRLQEPTDVFLTSQLGITHYDRLYVPGGAGALSPSGRDFFRAHQLQQECKYLVELHGVDRMIAIFHGPAVGGPDAALCADYRRKFGFAGAAEIRAQQEQDARGLIRYRWEWAGRANLQVYRCEVGANGELSFVTLHSDP